VLTCEPVTRSKEKPPDDRYLPRPMACQKPRWPVLGRACKAHMRTATSSAFSLCIAVFGLALTGLASRPCVLRTRVLRPYPPALHPPALHPSALNLRLSSSSAHAPMRSAWREPPWPSPIRIPHENTCAAATRTASLPGRTKAEIELGLSAVRLATGTSTAPFFARYASNDRAPQRASRRCLRHRHRR
jgi:hypothetical protein